MSTCWCVATPKQRRLVLCFTAIFATALAVRLSVVLLFATEPLEDLLWNDAVGWNLASGHGFTASQHEPRVPGIFRAPGYPAFLALIYSLYGHSHRAVYVAQAILDSGSAVLIGLIALRLAGVPTAVLASALYAVYPYAAFFCGVLHNDILLVFATGVLLLITVSRAGAGACGWALVGVVTGLTALIKPIFLLFAAMPTLAIWFGVPRCSRRTIATMALILGTTTAIAPWVVRNYVTFHAFPPLAVQDFSTTINYLLDELEGGEDYMVGKLRVPEADPARHLETLIDGHAFISAERARVRDVGAKLLRRWPEYLRLIAYHFPRLWITQRSLGHPPVFGIVAFALSWAVLVPGLIGMWFAGRDPRKYLPLYLTVLIITAMYAPYTAEARYTLPARPAMLVFVAFALLAPVHRWRVRRRRSNHGGSDHYGAGRA